MKIYMMMNNKNKNNIIEYFPIIVLEQKVNPKKKRNISTYKEDKIARHVTIKGVGAVGRLIKNKG